MYGYQTRFIPQAHVSEVVNLYHLSRVALSGARAGRYERLQWTLANYMRLHPDQSRSGAYKDIDCITTV